MNEEKKLLRAECKLRRNNLPPEQRAAWSEEICRRLSHLAVSRRFRRVGAFWPLGSEIDLRPLFTQHPDWVFFFPKVTSTSPPRLAWGPEPLEPGPWGLQEPILAQHFMPPVQLLLVPGLAFDPRGFRLGYGGGFYDALLTRLSEDVLALAVGFETQKVDCVPIGPHDVPVDGLMTERGLTWFRETEG